MVQDSGRIMVAMALGAALQLAALIWQAPGSTGANAGFEAGPFAGTWHVHTYYLRMNADGIGKASWPIHVGCGTGPAEGPPPCDKLVPATIVGPGGVVAHVQDIIDGGRADVILTSVLGLTAHGVIDHSTDQTTLPNGPVTFRISSQDVLYFTPSRPTATQAYDYLCGPRAYADQLSLGVNCGA